MEEEWERRGRTVGCPIDVQFGQVTALDVVAGVDDHSVAPVLPSAHTVTTLTHPSLHTLSPYLHTGSPVDIQVVQVPAVVVVADVNDHIVAGNRDKRLVCGHVGYWGPLYG